MASMTFQVNDASTSAGYPEVWVTITENADGTLTFSLTQKGGIVGDLRGVFFDLNDETVTSSLKVVGENITGFRTGDDSVKDLGDGANMNGLLGSDKGYDAGIKIGSAGIGNDDIQSYSFTLASSARALTLQDFANVDFGVRLTSVGTIGGSRGDSSKIMETTSAAIDARDDSACVDENATASGNVLANDIAPSGITTFTGWTGGGGTIALANAAGTTLTLNADGSWSLDASAADALSEGEHLTYSFTYSARNQTEATSWSDDSATFTVHVTGKNDGPDAQDDDGGHMLENGSLTGSVTANDTDVDRLDTHVWSLVSFGGEGNLTFNENGTWSYDAGGAYDYLNNGQSVVLSFDYAMTDNHGARDVATVSFRIDGVGGITPPPPPPPPPSQDDFPRWGQDISNITLVFHQSAGDAKPKSGDGYYTVKIDVPGSFNDDLDISIGAILAALDAADTNITGDSELLGVVIKGGLQVTNYYAYGDNNTNGTGADALPAGIGFSTDGTSANVSPTNAIDMTYTLGMDLYLA